MGGVGLLAVQQDGGEGGEGCCKPGHLSKLELVLVDTPHLAKLLLSEVRRGKSQRPTQSSAKGCAKAKVMLRRKPTGSLMRGEKELTEKKCLILIKPLPEKLMH